MNICFDTNDNPKQKICASKWIDNTTLDIVYGGAKGGGKSYLGCSLIFGDALLYPGTRYFIARKSLNDLRKFTRPSIDEVFSDWGISKNYYRFDGKDNFYELHNGSMVFLIEAKKMPSDPLYKRFGSMQMTRGWIEEAGEFDGSAKNHLFASLGRWKNIEYGLTKKLLQTCNPSKNYLYKEYYKKYIEKKLEDWKSFIQAFPKDNKKLPPDYVDGLLKVLSANEKERLIYGNWEYDDDPAVLIEYEKILDLFTNSFIERGIGYITADIARLGKDKTTIGVWSGLRCEKIITIHKSDLKEVVRVINELRMKYSIGLSNIICDEDGVGGGVVDFLGCIGFVNNSKAISKKNYANLKSQCYFMFAEYVNHNKIYITHENESVNNIIIEECEQIKSDGVDDEGKLRIIKKVKVKELIGHSTDYTDMLTMRMRFELSHNMNI